MKKIIIPLMLVLALITLNASAMDLTEMQKDQRAEIMGKTVILPCPKDWYYIEPRYEDTPIFKSFLFANIMQNPKDKDMTPDDITIRIFKRLLPDTTKEGAAKLANLMIKQYSQSGELESNLKLDLPAFKNIDMSRTPVIKPAHFTEQGDMCCTTISCDYYKLGDNTKYTFSVSMSMIVVDNLLMQLVLKSPETPEYADKVILDYARNLESNN